MFVEGEYTYMHVTLVLIELEDVDRKLKTGTRYKVGMCMSNDCCCHMQM